MLFLCNNIYYLCHYLYFAITSRHSKSWPCTHLYVCYENIIFWQNVVMINMGIGSTTSFIKIDIQIFLSDISFVRIVLPCFHRPHRQHGNSWSRLILESRYHVYLQHVPIFNLFILARIQMETLGMWVKSTMYRLPPMRFTNPPIQGKFLQKRVLYPKVAQLILCVVTRDKPTWRSNCHGYIDSDDHVTKAIILAGCLRRNGNNSTFWQLICSHENVPLHETMLPIATGRHVFLL